MSANEKNVKYRKSEVLPIRDGILFNVGNMTPKLTHIVLINGRNNMSEGISQKMTINHKQTKFNISQIAGVAYSKWHSQ